MDMDCLQYAVEKYNTPFYVFDLDELKSRVAFFRENFSYGVDICYAIKANPFLTEIMSEITDRIEVCSMGEFEICNRLKLAPEKLLISGVLKKKADITKIMNTYGGKCSYTVESIEQLQCFARWSEAHNERLKVYLRLTSGNQFGMDEETIADIIGSANDYPLLEIKGIHYFSGTQKKSNKKFEKELNDLNDFCLKIEEKYGFDIGELEYGPGLAVAYFEGQRDTLQEDLDTINCALSKMKWKGKVTLEMGRGLSASCGYYMTRILDIKRNGNKNYCIVDGGIHQLNYDGQIRGMYQPKCIYDSRKNYGEPEVWTICGSLCTANDVLIQRLELTKPKIGDVIIFENVGAYAMTEGMSLFLSHELPAVIMYSAKSGFKIVRKEQNTYRLNMEDDNNGRIN